MYPAAISGCDLATADTVLCRCEEVTRGELSDAIAAAAPLADANVVKGMTRAGMGLCQGRMCAAKRVRADRERHRDHGNRGACVHPAPASPPRCRSGRWQAPADYDGGDGDLPEDPDCIN